MSGEYPDVLPSQFVPATSCSTEQKSDGMEREQRTAFKCRRVIARDQRMHMGRGKNFVSCSVRSSLFPCSLNNFFNSLLEDQDCIFGSPYPLILISVIISRRRRRALVCILSTESVVLISFIISRRRRALICIFVITTDSIILISIIISRQRRARCARPARRLMSLVPQPTSMRAWRVHRKSRTSFARLSCQWSKN